VKKHENPRIQKTISHCYYALSERRVKLMSYRSWVSRLPLLPLPFNFYPIFLPADILPEMSYIILHITLSRWWLVRTRNIL